MAKQIFTFLHTESDNLEQAGLLRHELPMQSPSGATVAVGTKELLNLASNDYLGLATHQSLKRAAKAAIDANGLGMASPRIVTGTLPIHLDLEKAISKFLGTEETLVYPSGYHANTGVFESLLSDRDYLFCDEQVHPSLADGIRLCRARVFSYRNNDMDHLEDRLKRSRAARFRVVVTDGVFPLDGVIANLRAICDLADKYDAIVAVDDGQGLGVLGTSGRGTAEHLGVSGRPDIITGTFSNALGGGAGGFASGRKEIMGWLRQKSRPYLVSSALSPAGVAAGLEALKLVDLEAPLRNQLRENAKLLRAGLKERGLRIIDSVHPIIAVLLGDAVSTQRMADALYRKGIFVMGFCHPVVPEGEARVRAQVSAKHTQKALRSAIDAFDEAKRDLRLAQ